MPNIINSIKPNFLKPKINFKNISRFRFWSGIFVYLLYAFILFNFFVLLVEFFTITREATYFQGIKTYLDYKEYKFYIFFIAFYTLCYTFSLTINYWYNKPEMFFQNRRKRNFITYERNGFILTFSYWFFKLIILSLMFAYSSIISCINPYGNINYLLYLMALVLFLDLWKGFRRVFKVKLIHLIISLVVIILLSLSFTYFRPYNDYNIIKFLNKGFTNENFSLAFLESAETKRSKCNNSIFITKDNYIYLNGTKRQISDIVPFVRSSGFEPIYKYTCLYIDKNASLKTYNQLKMELRKADKLKLNIIINNDYCSSYKAIYWNLAPYYNNYLNIKITTNNQKIYYLQNKQNPIVVNIPPYLEELEIAEKNLIKIEQTKEHLLFNDSIILLNNLQELLVAQNNKDKLILFNCDENLKFQKYIEVLNEIKNSIIKQRDILAFKETNLSYKKLKDKAYFENNKYKNKLILIRKNHPFRILENYTIVKNN